MSLNFFEYVSLTA